MVTFFCNNCGQYLKKKQAEMHGYCNNVLSCNECKKDISGFEAIKGHTTCGMMVKGHQKKLGQSPNNANQVKVEPVQPVVPTIHSNTTAKLVKERNEEKPKTEAIETTEEIEWTGFRNTLRRIVKRQPQKQIGKITLKKKLRFIYEQFNPDLVQNYDNLFEQKLQKVRNIQLVGDKVVYNL
jgi:hypothetical protein